MVNLMQALWACFFILAAVGGIIIHMFSRPNGQRDNKTTLETSPTRERPALGEIPSAPN